MEEIEESAIPASAVTPKVWKRNVDDTFCIIKKDILLLNMRTFLGTIYVDVYRKPKHFNSHHDIKHKESTTATLLHRTFNLPNTTEGRNGEIDKDYSVLQSNGYSSKLIHNITTRRTRSSMIPSP